MNLVQVAGDIVGEFVDNGSRSNTCTSLDPEIVFDYRDNRRIYVLIHYSALEMARQPLDGW